MQCNVLSSLQYDFIYVAHIPHHETQCDSIMVCPLITAY